MNASDSISLPDSQVARLSPAVLMGGAVLWLLLVGVLAIAALQKEVRFDSSLMALLPQEAFSQEEHLQKPLFQDQQVQGKQAQVKPTAPAQITDPRALLQQANDQIAQSFSNRYLLLLSGPDDAALRDAVADVAQQLKKLPVITEITWQVTAAELQQRQQELFAYRFLLLDDKLRQQLLQGDSDPIRQKALLRLYSPVSVQVGTLPEDPFGLYSEWLLNQSQGLNIALDRQRLKVNAAQPSTTTQSDTITYLLMLTFSGDTFALSTQQQVLHAIEQQEEKLLKQNISLQQSGLLRHAAAGARQASTEISTIGVGSLLGILLLLWLVFRSAMPMVMVLVPLTVAVLTATAVTGLYFGSIHLITLAFGAGLIGVSIDYSLHYLCEYQGLRNYRELTQSAPANRCQSASLGELALGRVWPGLLLGLFSSVAAYGVLAIPPFPGLQQMALFSVVGLCSAWLSVVLLFPLFSRFQSIKPDRVQASSNTLGQRFYQLQQSVKEAIKQVGPMSRLTLLAGVLMLAGYSLVQSSYQDDVRLLQTSPPELLEAEAIVQQRLGSFSSSRFLLLRCADWQQCLEQEERLQPELAQLQQQGVFQRYQAVSQQLASLKKQQENKVLVQSLYERELGPFFRKLKLSDAQQAQAQAFLTTTPDYLTPEHWLTLSSSEGLRELLVSDNSGGVNASDVAGASNRAGSVQYASMIRFSGLTQQPEQLDKLKQLAQQYPSVDFTDRIATISELMAGYRAKVISWLLWAYALVFLVLLWRYKQQVWRVVAPPLLASLLTLALVAQLEQGINLFHIMALILVLGIGLDMGIFLQESRGAFHTWIAVSLSSCTSLLAFGLLTLSQTPVLHHFGLVVLLGLTLTWSLAFLFSNNNVTECLDDDADAARNH